MSDTLREQPFMSHLLELRDRLMRSVLAVLLLLQVLFPFGNDIYTFIAEPLMKVLPEGASMIATRVASPFLTPFKLSLVAAVFLAMPYLLYQLWSFIAPGLYHHEKRLALPMLASSIFLFYLGAAFAYVVVFPLVFAFLTSTAPKGVLVMTDITEYLDFVLTLFVNGFKSLDLAMFTLDDEEIFYPYANDGEIDFMLSVAQKSYDLFKDGVTDGGTIVVDPNLVKPTEEDRKKYKIIEIPIITIAKEEVKNVITQSVVALACANTLMKAIDEQTLIDVMLSKVPPKVHEANKLAFSLGKKYAEEAMK